MKRIVNLHKWAALKIAQGFCSIMEDDARQRKDSDQWVKWHNRVADLMHRISRLED